MATNNKYDRQIRLWGASGQRALGETCIVLIRATAVGTETIKNMVLPGVGSIFVLDDVAYCCNDGINTKDYASNFFVVAAEVQQQQQQCITSRAEMALKHLQELNPDVEGSWKHVPEGLETTDFAAFFRNVATSSCHSSHHHHNIKKLLIVASDLEPRLLQHVAMVCQQQALSLIAVHSYGLLGIVRLQTPPLPLLQPKLRDAPPDLRLQTFAKLQQLAQQVGNKNGENDDDDDDDDDWSTLDNQQHAHIPYPLILVKQAQKWKKTHNGALPTTFAEKQEFQATIKAAARNWDNELNFQEAVANAYLTYAPRELDLDHLATLRDVSATACPNLHALLLGLDQFLKRHGANQPPLQGTIPDMTASTEWYVQLQQAYKDQAEQDWKEMRALVPSSVSDEEVTVFCQNVFALDLLLTRSLQDELTKPIPSDVAEDLVMATMEGDERPDQVPLLWYLGFRACQVFYEQSGRYPGTEEAEYNQDIATMRTILVNVVQRYGLKDTELLRSTILKNPQDFATELTRYANAEIHNIASIVGGVASQEAVKLITGQYIPLNNTYIYNGIASTGGVYQF